MNMVVVLFPFVHRSIYVDKWHKDPTSPVMTANLPVSQQQGLPYCVQAQFTNIAETNINPAFQLPESSNCCYRLYVHTAVENKLKNVFLSMCVLYACFIGENHKLHDVVQFSKFVYNRVYNVALGTIVINQPMVKQLRCVKFYISIKLCTLCLEG